MTVEFIGGVARTNFSYNLVGILRPVLKNRYHLTFLLVVSSIFSPSFFFHTVR